MIRTSLITAAVTATTPLLARVATQAGLTVAAYLHNHGIHPQWIAQWGGVLGKKAKAAYRAATGADPRTRREGRYDVAAYDTTEYLDIALAHYRDHKKAGPQLTAGYDRSKAATKAPRDARGRFVRVLTLVWTTPAGRQVRKVTADQATALLRLLTRHHHVTGLTVRDSHGRRTDFALAA